MFSSSCSEACGCGNPTTDTVKVDMEGIEQQAEEAERKRAQEEVEEEERQEMLRRQKESEERRQAQEVADRAKREAEAREAKRKAEEAARLEADEKAERERRETQEAEAHQQKEELAVQRVAQDEIDQKRKAEVAAFLKKEKFKGGAWEPRKSCCGSTYPLHRAAEKKDAAMCEMLIQEGADPQAMNSSKKTAYEVAEKMNKNGAYNDVLTVLRGGKLPDDSY
mmetsp:Transcript_44000/g.113743  ORF Transcript_44000/g.113743 Transcript_44000/m.113743 type:complete len:223 (+) Transcript_44000:66-734(+)